MTRINVGIDPKILTTKHLIAEHREIKRVPNQVKSGRLKVENIPSEFTLGKGHVKFFVNKLGYLLERYRAIYLECKRRGFNVQNYSSAWKGVPVSLMGSYSPTVRDAQVIMERLISKDSNYSHV